MSGGSYDYLCFAAGDASTLGQKLEALNAMARRLDDIDADSHAACDTREVLAIIAALETASRRLESVWHAAEWRDSGDWSEAQLRETLAAYGAERAREESE